MEEVKESNNVLNEEAKKNLSQILEADKSQEIDAS